jgi:hypothetical protein
MNTQKIEDLLAEYDMQDSAFADDLRALFQHEAALAEPDVPQPKAGPGSSLVELRDMLRAEVDRLIAASEAPQPRKRLTDAEIARMASGLEGCDGLPVNSTKANWRKVFDFARAIEAAVWGEKA